MNKDKIAVRALDAIAEKVGGYTALADKLGVARTTPYYWQRIGGVPLDKVDSVCAAAGVTPKQVRPDLADKFQELATKFSQ